tara:strand:- start:603 stop:953 length:351 start_codon:yes stop_codon:yes gene_type:complete
MKVSKSKLRSIIREEKRKILKEELSLDKTPCPHATADALMASGMSAGEILGWVSSLVTDLSQAEVSPPETAVVELPPGIGHSAALESRFRRKTAYKNNSKPQRTVGLIPGFGFTRN